MFAAYIFAREDVNNDNNFSLRAVQVFFVITKVNGAAITVTHMCVATTRRSCS